jgi:hypothetical protein
MPFFVFIPASCFSFLYTSVLLPYNLHSSFYIHILSLSLPIAVLCVHFVLCFSTYSVYVSLHLLPIRLRKCVNELEKTQTKVINLLVTEPIVSYADTLDYTY